MAITIKRVKNERGVALRTLKVGDTFLLNKQVGVIASDNEHAFPLNLSTCKSFFYKDPCKQWDSSRLTEMVDSDTIVLPIEVEMTYKVVG